MERGSEGQEVLLGIQARAELSTTWNCHRDLNPHLWEEKRGPIEPNQARESEEIINYCHFKPVNFVVVCKAATDNW